MELWARNEKGSMRLCVTEREREKEQERQGKRETQELQDGLYAFKLKSQSYVVLFLKRKSEDLAEALP